MTWCHGTTGLGDAACPSAQPNPARDLITYFDAPSSQQIDYGVPGLQDFIDDGYVVCATDYQGLGTPGQHDYMVNRTQARDAVYLVHAARQLDVGMGTKFGAVGWSQGGGGSAAVAELDPEDYGDLKLVGTVAMSPVAAIVAYETPVGLSAALGNQKIAPDSHVAMMLAGFQIANPDTLKLSDYFTPLGVEILETSWNIQPVHHLNDTIARIFRLKGPVMQSPPTNLDAWKAAITNGMPSRISRSRASEPNFGRWSRLGHKNSPDSMKNIAMKKLSVASTTQSTPSGKSAGVLKQGLPSISARPGLTRCTSPLKPKRARLPMTPLPSEPGVGTDAGDTALTRMPFGPSSAPSTLVMVADMRQLSFSFDSNTDFMPSAHASR